MSISDVRERYERWWLGKYCKPVSLIMPFKKVVKINMYGPPSFVYGVAELVFDDGTSRMINHGNAFKPRKKDVLVKPETENLGTEKRRNNAGNREG